MQIGVWSSHESNIELNGLLDYGIRSHLQKVLTENSFLTLSKSTNGFGSTILPGIPFRGAGGVSDAKQSASALSLRLMHEKERGVKCRDAMICASRAVLCS